MYPKGALTRRTPGTPGNSTTPPVILGPRPRGSTLERGIKLLPLKQMLQRLLILLAQVQADNWPENQPNENQHVMNNRNFKKRIQ